MELGSSTNSFQLLGLNAASIWCNTFFQQKFSARFGEHSTLLVPDSSRFCSNPPQLWGATTASLCRVTVHISTFVRCSDSFTFEASSRFCSNPPQFWGAETTSVYIKLININSSNDVVPLESHRGDVALPEFGPLIGRLDLIGLRETSTPPG